jgi:hypothetical protein
VFQPAYELLISLVAVAAITVAYLFLAQEGLPAPASAVGHTLGIVGFAMMLGTETLYSVRKRWPNFHWGRMSTWLQSHIFMGLVGPYLVLLHTSWKFNGLAGVLTLLTAVVVVSGVVGRYIYTAVPRDLEGHELTVFQLEEQIAGIDRQMQEQGIQSLTTSLDVADRGSEQGWFLVLARPLYRWRQNRQLRRLASSLDAEGRAKAEQMMEALKERQRLRMEVRLLGVTRRVMALWQLFHIPLSVVLFVVAFAHIIAAVYYATLMQ